MSTDVSLFEYLTEPSNLAILSTCSKDPSKSLTSSFSCALLSAFSTRSGSAYALTISNVFSPISVIEIVKIENRNNPKIGIIHFQFLFHQLLFSTIFSFYLITANV
jgi:hypothetical protein